MNPSWWTTVFSGIHRVLYPLVCVGCGQEESVHAGLLCVGCQARLSLTHHATQANNDMETRLWGRFPTVAAAAYCYFVHEGVGQQLVHALKYEGKKEVGLHFGALFGQELLASRRFQRIDALVPVPLHPTRQWKRGYNQSQLLAEGMASTMNLPIWSKALSRTEYSISQTRKTQAERQENVTKAFVVSKPAILEGKHLLLVDDVFTTGATLESCAQVLLEVSGVKLSVATLAMTSDA